MGLFHEHIILPLSDIIRGEYTYKYLHLLKEAEQWTFTERTTYQNDKIKKLICYAANNIPFYQEWFLQSGIKAEDICTKNDLQRLPVVDKNLIRKEGLERFVSKSYPKRLRLVECSSGSTGEPFVYYSTKEAYSCNMAAKLRTWYQSGYCLGDKYMKIVNSPRKGKLKKLQDRVNNCIYIPFSSMTDERLAAILTIIDKEGPSIIRSYPAPLFLLAQYRNTHSGYMFSPKHIMTTGSTLPTAYREEIEKAFGCDIIDSYSCEGTPNTYETPLHDGYRVTDYYGIIEVLDDDNKPVINGIGRVVSTDLWNYAQPFIRYNTQDLVEVCDSRIVRIMGRECESFISIKGKRYTVHNISCFFVNSELGVNSYQVVKRKDGTILFRLVVNNNYNEGIQQYIIDYWTKEFGNKVFLELVSSIPLMSNNKHNTIINE